MRFLASAMVLTAALALAACGGGGGSTGSTSSTEAPAERLDVTLTATTHNPRAGAPWPIVIRAYSSSDRPLRAEVRYQYLFGGAVVARRSHYRFRGTFHDTFKWPARSAGIPLTFRAIVTTPLGTRKLDYAVRVRK